MRLQKIRPPPYPPRRAAPPVHNHHQIPNPNHNPAFHRPRPRTTCPCPCRARLADSPVSAYMRILENSLFSATPPGLLPPRLLPLMLTLRLQQQLPDGALRSTLITRPAAGAVSRILLRRPDFNLLSPTPRSPYLPLAGVPATPPLTPNFPMLSPLPGTGILGPGPMPAPPPGLWFPQSPSGLLTVRILSLLSPRWRDIASVSSHPCNI
ncbi:hypothetical protein ZWY2020_007005 [Hordeum vulgare]|nr:hypothetical protein ZWY2020_007005 [Hordeum vulgare]